MGNSNCDKCGHDTNMCDCKSSGVKQIGGDHYQAEYQHWDWVIDAGLGYLDGNATKYIPRWKKKGGLNDLLKAKSYIDKMLNRYVNVARSREDIPADIIHATDRFISANKIEADEAAIIRMIAVWTTRHDLTLISEAIEEYTLSMANWDAQEMPKGGLAGLAAPTLAGQAKETPQKPAEGRFGAAAGQGKAAPSGMAHPFGYDGEDDGA